MLQLSFNPTVRGYICKHPRVISTTHPRRHLHSHCRLDRRRLPRPRALILRRTCLRAQRMTTYFQIFSLPPHLVIDTPALKKSFYALSRRLHPDRFAATPAAEQEEALAKPSRLN